MRMDDCATQWSVLGQITSWWQPCKGFCDQIFVDVIGNTVCTVALLELWGPSAAPDKVLVPARCSL
jgi:hypothetical protein